MHRRRLLLLLLLLQSWKGKGLIWILWGFSRPRLTLLLLLVLHEDALLLEEQLLLLLLNAGRLRMLRRQAGRVLVVGCRCRCHLLLLLGHRLGIQADKVGASRLSGRARVRSAGGHIVTGLVFI